MSLVAKLPLDLNSESKVLLVTFLDSKVPLKPNHVLDILKGRWQIAKIVFMPKKNLQALIELSSVEEAVEFKESYENGGTNGLFKMKVHYTRKEKLNINKSSDLEFDFAQDQAHKKAQTTNNLFEREDINDYCANSKLNNNIIPSMQSFDEPVEVDSVPYKSISV